MTPEQEDEIARYVEKYHRDYGYFVDGLADRLSLPVSVVLTWLMVDQICLMRAAWADDHMARLRNRHLDAVQRYQREAHDRECHQRTIEQEALQKEQMETVRLQRQALERYNEETKPEDWKADG